MVAVHVPAPTRRPAADIEIDVDGLRHELEHRVDGEVRFDAGSRSAYSTDASNFRQVPIGVVVPRTVEAGAEVVAVCREFGAPILSRGGGTSLAGECTNVAVVIDWSKYCNRLLSVDAERRTCIVEPGIVLDHLNDLLRDHDLEYGPEPATHNHCTIGGMIGNNSCGATAQRTGKVVDNIERLEVLLYDGTRTWVGQTSDEEYERIVAAGGRPAEIYRRLRQLRDEHLEQLRTRYPQIPRRVSGYNLDSLLPEQHFHVAKTLVGSEGTLVTVLRAELRLVPRVPARSLVVLGFPDIAAAADAVPDILPHKPIALEGIDHLLIAFQQRKHLNPHALQFFPDGQGFLLVQFGGADPAEARRRAEDMVRALGRDSDGKDVTHFDDEEHERQVWQVRESGLGATARVPGLPDTWPGWEDSAVAPDRLGDYLRDLRRLYDEFGFGGASLYGHFGQGCVHSRIPFDLVTAEGVRAYRTFLERAADLVVSYGGSFSGEHGDGQQRGELLPKMFGPDLVRAFEQCKAIFDPGNRMNPGKVVTPNRLDDNLRLGTDLRHPAPATHFAYPDDEGSFSRAVQRCVGVGKCRREGGGVMCPSYMATREEEHSTRGRSRLLFEMLDGTARGGAIGDGWRSEAVRDALDLCLACKGCKTDCPVNVDMATYKAEFLAHHYQGRLRPRQHYAMGWLPLWAALAARAPRIVNALAHAGPVGTMAKRAAGVDVRRDLPVFANRTFQRWFRRHRPAATGSHGDVVLWPDTFTNHFDPAIAQAAVEVLQDAGWWVVVPQQAVCCGLTWISTGQLDTAKRVLQRTLDILRPHLRAGTPIVGLEPSCTAVFRSDAHELFPGDEDVQRLQRQTYTLAELLHEHTPGWQPPRVHRKALIQTHCHQHAIMGFTADQALLHDAGVDAQVLDSGCCGLAGNFGFEEGHYEVSEACAERVLVPAVRDADPHDVVLADGFSCRTQIAQSATGGRRGMHLAELLRAGLHDDDGRAAPERSWAPRPAPPRIRATAVTAIAVGGAAVAAGFALARRRR
ncbi:FAD-binding and (Fe-S)-binding domain-containing protein [Dactylosporangium sp. CA-139114]|uniref:FAD-binding and (Fe-S)-binding domain-containing protein n=1 Tax=Dactylosporangium sp. CA-139114 TaxID=3239931 RepID=UPI003D96EAF6